MEGMRMIKEKARKREKEVFIPPILREEQSVIAIHVLDFVCRRLDLPHGTFVR
jgi:hypothetical protein